MKKKARKSRSIKYWGKLVAEHQESDLSVRQFCLSRDINFHTFKNWRWRLRDKIGPGEKPTGKFVEVAPLKPSDFIDSCDQQSEPSADVAYEELKTKSGLTLRYGDGWSIDVPCGFDESTLSRVIRVLGV
jgi:hypothetical protein